MNTDPNLRDPAVRDPLDPRDPAAEPRAGYTDPRVTNHIETRNGSSRAGLALAAIVAALLVVGFIAFSGSSGVDETPTASTGDQNVIVPGGNGPVQPDAMAPTTPAPSTEAPQAVPAPQQQAPATIPQDNAPAGSQ